MITHFFHYFSIVCAVALNAISVGIGQGLANITAINAMNIQPSSRNEISRASLFGTALIETSAVLGAFIALALLASRGFLTLASEFQGPAELGIALAICIPGLTLGIVTALPARAACIAVTRQPFYVDKIIRFMIICISLMQTPIIFGLIISLIIISQLDTILYWQDVLRIIGAGTAIGLGSIGPSIGLGMFTKQVCLSLGIRRKSYDTLFSFSLMRIAVIETPLIFALVISLLLLFFVPPAASEDIVAGIGFLAAGLAVGIGTFGAGISSARTAAAAAQYIAINPQSANILSQTSLLGQGMIEASVIYPTIVAFFLIFINVK
jgi:F0F1-type ATP synthase membrane subunit c/vacuolar-type H+-ATPase subunit K